MKIVNHRHPRYPVVLVNVRAGDVVEFETRFYPGHAPDAKFLVLRVPAEYIREDKRYKNGAFRIMVANIETGYVSLVTTDRAVRIFEAEVTLQ